MPYKILQLKVLVMRTVTNLLASYIDKSNPNNTNSFSIVYNLTNSLNKSV